MAEVSQRTVRLQVSSPPEESVDCRQDREDLLYTASWHECEVLILSVKEIQAGHVTVDKHFKQRLKTPLVTHSLQQRQQQQQHLPPPLPDNYSASLTSSSSTDSKDQLLYDLPALCPYRSGSSSSHSRSIPSCLGKVQYLPSTNIPISKPPR